MSLPKQENIEIIQGAQFVKTLHWYGGGKVYDTIDNVTVGHPTSITVTGHGLPSTSATPVSINGVKGTARVLNTGTKDCDMVLASYVDANTFTVPIATVGKLYTTGTGYIEWYQPKDLTNYTARMQIREDVDSTSTLVSLTSTGGDIAIVAADAKITITIATTVTAALDFETAVYDLELVDASGEATRILEGEVTLSKEVTR